MPNESNGTVDGKSDLVERMRQGDSAAFDLLIKQAMAWLPVAAARRLRRKPWIRASPDDIVQVTLGRATADRENFRGQNEPAFKAWLEALLKAAVEDAVDWDRREKRSPLREEPDDKGVRLAEAERRPGGSTPTTPTKAARRSELAEKVRQALDKLEPDDRQVIELRAFRDLEFSEIARQLQISGEAARSRYRRALERFSGLLDPPASELL